MKCSECIHDEVCIYKDSRRRLEGKTTFIAEITCKHAMSWDMRSFMKSEVNPDQAKFRYTYPDNDTGQPPIMPTSIISIMGL